MKYRRRPIVVEAIQYHKDNPLVKPEDWGLCYERSHNAEVPHIHTLEGIMVVSDEDWIIEEPFPTDDRKFYLCKPDIFEETYDPAPEVYDDVRVS